MNTINKLSMAFAGFSKVERIVSEKIINNPQIVVDCSITKSAEKYGVSTSSIQRVAKKIGFSGYSEFRFALSNDLKEDAVKMKSEDDFFSKIIEGYKLEFDLIKEKDLYNQAKQLCELIFTANKVYIMGIGGTAYIAGYCSHMLFTSGVATYLIDDESKAERIETIVQKGDLFIMFSVSGGELDHRERILSLSKTEGTIVLLSATENPSNKELVDMTIELPGFPIILSDNTKTKPYIDNRLLFHVFVSLIIFLTKRKKEEME